MCWGEISGHTGMHIDRFDEINGGYGKRHRNMEGKILPEFCLEKESCISNTCS